MEQHKILEQKIEGFINDFENGLINKNETICSLADFFFEYGKKAYINGSTFKQ